VGLWEVASGYICGRRQRGRSAERVNLDTYDVLQHRERWNEWTESGCGRGFRTHSAPRQRQRQGNAWAYRGESVLHSSQPANVFSSPPGHSLAILRRESSSGPSCRTRTDCSIARAARGVREDGQASHKGLEILLAKGLGGVFFARGCEAKLELACLLNALPRVLERPTARFWSLARCRTSAGGDEGGAFQAVHGAVRVVLSLRFGISCSVRACPKWAISRVSLCSLSRNHWLVPAYEKEWGRVKDEKN
jgi:hypothetical protein